MTIATMPPLQQLRALPTTLPLDNAVRLELEEGVPIFRATAKVQQRIEALLAKEKVQSLTKQEQQELDFYEEVDDYLSFVNRTVRNLLLAQAAQNA